MPALIKLHACRHQWVTVAERLFPSVVDQRCIHCGEMRYDVPVISDKEIVIEGFGVKQKKGRKVKP